MSGGVIPNLGGVSIQLRPQSPFFLMDLSKSMGSWHRRWFYVSGLEDSLSAFFDGSPTRLNSWESPDDLPKDVELLMAAVAHQKERGLMGIHITRSWVERHALPL